MSTASLLWGISFSAIGVGFFVYGKRQGMIVPWVCGLGLIPGSSRAPYGR